MSENTYVARWLNRARENFVEIEEVICVCTRSRNISTSSAVTSSVHKILMSNNLETWFLEQLERPPPEETRNQLEDKFEDHLMRILRRISNYNIFINILGDIKQEINVGK